MGDKCVDINTVKVLGMAV